LAKLWQKIKWHLFFRTRCSTTGTESPVRCEFLRRGEEVNNVKIGKL